MIQTWSHYQKKNLFLNNRIFVSKQNGSKLQIFMYNFFQKLFFEWKPYFANIVCKSLNEKNLSNRPSRQIKLHPTSWQYPLINYSAILQVFLELSHLEDFLVKKLETSLVSLKHLSSVPWLP